MTSKVDLLKRERDDQRKLADNWKLQHDEHKRLNNKLLDRVEDFKAEVSRLTAENDFLANDRDGYVQLLTDQNARLTAEVRVRQTIVEEARDERDAALADVERLRAALEAICMMDISWVGDAFKLKDIARAALSGDKQ